METTRRLGNGLAFAAKIGLHPAVVARKIK